MTDLPSAGQSGRFDIAGPAGTLKATVSMPQRPFEPPLLALVCHPHPLYGGTMENKVVTTLSRACTDAGLVAVRFNFRGVGGSEGSFSGAEGETEDAIAVLDWAIQATGARHFVLAGFSFGAYVSLRLARVRRPLQLVSVAPPLNYTDAPAWVPPACPWLVIHGDADDVVDCRQTLERLKGVRPPPQVHVLAGVGHFFHGRLGDLRTLIAPVLQSRLSELQKTA